MKRFFICFSTLLLGCVFYVDAFAGFARGQFSAVYAFGDSLSDQGNYGTPSTTQPCMEPFLPTEYAPLTNNCQSPSDQYCGKVWVAYLASELGLPLAASSQGGTDYAVVGEPYYSSTQQSIYQQVANFVGYPSNFHSIDPNALYVIWGGANDFLVNIQRYIENDIDVNTLNTLMTYYSAPPVVAYTALDVSLLISAGAKNIVIINLPNLSLTPLTQIFIQPTDPTEATYLATAGQQFNANLLASIEKIASSVPFANVYMEDAYTFLGTIAANPEQAGFKYGPPYNWCSSSQVGNPSKYLFFNYVHPSSYAHYLIAQDVMGCGNPSGTYCHKL